MAIYTSGLICQEAIEESGQIFSAIRIIDRIEVDLPTEIDPEKTIIANQIACVALLLIRTDGPEVFDVTFTAVAPVPPGVLDPPSGLRMLPREFKGIHSGGGVHGHQMRLNLKIDPRLVGLWWFEVAVNNALVLKMPLELLRAKDTDPTSSSEIQSPSEQSPP